MSRPTPAYRLPGTRRALGAPWPLLCATPAGRPRAAKGASELAGSEARWGFSAQTPIPSPASIIAGRALYIRYSSLSSDRGRGASARNTTAGRRSARRCLDRLPSDEVANPWLAGGPIRVKPPPAVLQTEPNSPSANPTADKWIIQYALASFLGLLSATGLRDVDVKYKYINSNRKQLSQQTWGIPNLSCSGVNVPRVVTTPPTSHRQAQR
ncbi:uncharacterized protein CIMG_13317 [Coccidioides immitis RS]|uniref:Uncharacterized protein n=1 Tax=Coccidioides immitis (strain RS) TaxID=246410 RepID=J3K3V9_COCIM|nr:uncharacterized protein CIMG_13317 [Coccidioides immitis RS]EAS28926.3 hypothetical protein CIMG_13317 [Coccidioides immitis RS]